MILKQLKITQFKNYASQSLTLSPRLNCFVGLNGMGKTNLLDAIHYLCLCKSNRGIPDKNLVQHQKDFFRLEGLFEKNGQTDKVVAKFIPNQRKEFEHNGTVYPKLSDHIGQFPVVMIAPDDVTLVQDGSEERRRFLDATLSQIFPEYLQNLMLYNNLLKQRNALLKQMGEERRFDATLLESIDRQMPAPAKVIFEKRNIFCNELQPLFIELYAEISCGHEKAGISYESDMEGHDLRELFQAALEKDRYLQRTSTGPQRDDIALTLDSLPIKKFASQGQLKSYLLALRLAQYEVLRKEKGIAPLLLLDDIFDKLDDNRVRQLIGLLIEREYGQIFITDTQRNRIETVVQAFTGDYEIHEVDEGKITE